jgi:excisionase family DNA binding protein
MHHDQQFKADESDAAPGSMSKSRRDTDKKAAPAGILAARVGEEYGPGKGSAVAELLTPADVAALCKVSVKTVLRAIRSGRLRASRLGSRHAYRIRAADIDPWLASTTVRAAPTTERVIAELPTIHRSATRSNRLTLTEEMGRRR